MTTRSGRVEIVLGPGKWDMMLAVFDGKKVCFTWGGTEETRYHIHELWPDNEERELEIIGISFYDHEKLQCGFTTFFPHGGAKTMVNGEYNLGTRIGTIDLTPLCVIGVLPWPK